jgi:putative hemolysin
MIVRTAAAPTAAARTAAALALLAAAILAACSEPPPWTLSAAADRITLRWYPSDADPLATQAAAQAKADAHCAPIGRRASLVANEQNGSVQIATYECR